MKRKAFTLAEVLIVIGIIGIIADMTIPGLMKSYEKLTYVTQLQKAYSTLSQGFKMMMANENITDLETLALLNSPQSEVDNYFKAAFKIHERCLFVASCKLLPKIYLDLNKKSLGAMDNLAGVYIFKTMDAAIYMIWITANNGGLIMIDVNGIRKPNTAGRDLFYFGYDKFAKIIPYEELGGSTCGTIGSKIIPSTHTGTTCSKRIMEEGWKMNY